MKDSRIRHKQVIPIVVAVAAIAAYMIVPQAGYAISVGNQRVSCSGSNSVCVIGGNGAIGGNGGTVSGSGNVEAIGSLAQGSGYAGGGNQVIVSSHNIAGAGGPAIGGSACYAYCSAASVPGQIATSR